MTNWYVSVLSRFEISEYGWIWAFHVNCKLTHVNFKKELLKLYTWHTLLITTDIFRGLSTSNDDISQLACLLEIFKWPISKTQTKNTQKGGWSVSTISFGFLFLTGDSPGGSFAFSVLPPGSHQQRGVLRRVQESTGWENLTGDQWVAEQPGFTWKLYVFEEMTIEKIWEEVNINDVFTNLYFVSIMSFGFGGLTVKWYMIDEVRFL